MPNHGIRATASSREGADRQLVVLIKENGRGLCSGGRCARFTVSEIIIHWEETADVSRVGQNRDLQSSNFTVCSAAGNFSGVQTRAGRLSSKNQDYR